MSDRDPRPAQWEKEDARKWVRARLVRTKRAGAPVKVRPCDVSFHEDGAAEGLRIRADCACGVSAITTLDLDVLWSSMDSGHTLSLARVALAQNLVRVHEARLGVSA